MLLWFGVAVGGEIDVFGKPTAEENGKRELLCKVRIGGGLV